MISQVFKAILITSLAGSALTGVICLFRPITKKHFGYSWHYYIWLCVLAVMLIPVRFSAVTVRMPNTLSQAVQTAQTNGIGQTGAIGNAVQTGAVQMRIFDKTAVIWDEIIYAHINILAYLWLAGALFLILLNIARYISLNVKIRKQTEDVILPEISEYTDRKVNVRVWENVSSPFMTGIVNPTLVLPKKELSREQLRNILRHEMTHFKRNDILYKWFAEFAACVHWFNPVARYVSKQIAAECEISCDMAVTKNMSDSEEMSYINTILSLLPTGRLTGLPLTTQMTGSKKVLKRRFIMIKNKKKTSKTAVIISVVAAVAVLITAVYASGILSNFAKDNGNFAEKPSQYDKASPEYTAEQFFYLFSDGDFENMKRYCTQSCIDGFFGDDYVFGMNKATLKNITAVDNPAEKGFTNGEWVALAEVTMTPDDKSVFDPNQTETSFYLILKQQDGKYLIDEFASGL